MTTPDGDHAGVIAPPPLIFLASCLAGLAVDWWWPVRLGAEGTPRWIGMTLVAQASGPELRFQGRPLGRRRRRSE